MASAAILRECFFLIECWAMWLHKRTLLGSCILCVCGAAQFAQSQCHLHHIITLQNAELVNPLQLYILSWVLTSSGSKTGHRAYFFWTLAYNIMILNHNTIKKLSIWVQAIYIVWSLCTTLCTTWVPSVPLLRDTVPKIKVKRKGMPLWVHTA